MDKREQEFSAIANAELQSFMSPLFIWRSIWEEIVPRKEMDPGLTYDREPWASEIFHDQFGITTGRYGLIRLLALWYICGAMYQGHYPPTLMIRNMIAHRVGEDRPFARIGNTKGERSYRAKLENTARSTALEAIDPILSKRGIANRRFGWFVDETRKQATEGRSETSRTRYITDANEYVIQNVFAVVNTALTVAKIVQSDEHIVKHTESLLASCAKDGATGKEMFGLLNQPTGESFTMTVIRHIRRELRANGFVDEEKDTMKVASLREETEPKVNFFDYENVERYSVEDHFDIPKDKIAEHIEQARDLQRRRPWEQAE